MTSADQRDDPAEIAPTTLDLLVLGGTSWLGGTVAKIAHRRGHRVTCLARGESGSPPDGVTFVRADRTEPQAYDEVADRDWDAVVDVSRQPDQVRSALERLSGRTGLWVYVSTVSVYADDSTPDTDERAELHPAHSGSGPVGDELYGPAKVACEEAVLAASGRERSLVARAGLIAGGGDRSDRLGYWPARIARADDLDSVLLPPRQSAFQVIDVDDLAWWLVRSAEERTTGIFNAVGPVTDVGAVIDECCAATGRVPRFVEASDAWLQRHQVEPWAGAESLPLWLPQSGYAGFMTRSNQRAVQAGLVLRPLAETVRATLEWELELGLDRERRAGLSPGRERELLDELPDRTTSRPAADER